MSITLTMSKRYLEDVFQRAWKLEIDYKDKYEAIENRLKATRVYTLWVFPTTQFKKADSTGYCWGWWVNARDRGYISQDEYEFIKAYKRLWNNGLSEILRDTPSDDDVQVSIDTAANICKLEKNCSIVSYHGNYI
jgi:hypothetical protein